MTNKEFDKFIKEIGDILNLPQIDVHLKAGTIEPKGVSEEQEEFSREFKREAMRLIEEARNLAAELSRELGIRRNQLYKLKELTDRHRGNAFSGPGGIQ